MADGDPRFGPGAAIAAIRLQDESPTKKRIWGQGWPGLGTRLYTSRAPPIRFYALYFVLPLVLYVQLLVLRYYHPKTLFAFVLQMEMQSVSQ